MTATARKLIQPNHESDLLRAGNFNTLVVGPDASVANALHSLRHVCRQPVTTLWATSSLVLPHPSRTGALILRDVGSLTREGQYRLMVWLGDARGRTQVIATDADAVWPRVSDGAFSARLYYRLNLIYIDLADGPHSRDGQTLSR